MAVKLKTARRFTRVSNSAYKNIKPEFFGTKENGKLNHRRYFPIELGPDEAESVISNSSTARTIKRTLADNGYEITDYIHGYAKVKGDTKNQKLRIGKILSGLGEHIILEQFKKDDIRNITNLAVVISRHPYDIVGMSTGRGWNSCMSEDSSNFAYVKTDIHMGTLIAYLVKKSDKNIKDPLGRLLFKKYENDAGFSYYSPASRVYGIDNAYFKSTCKKIAAELNQDAPESVYTFPSHFYNDGEDTTIDTRSEETIRKMAQRERLRRLNSAIAAFLPFEKYLTMVTDKIETISNLANISGFAAELSVNGGLSPNDYAEFFNNRSSAFGNGTPARYLEFVKDKIYSMDGSKSIKDSTFMDFLDDIEVSEPDAFLKMGDLVKDVELPFRVVKRFNTGYTVAISDNKPKYGLIDDYDFNTVLDTIGDCIMKMEDGILNRSPLAETKMFSNWGEPILKNNNKRSKKYEYAIVFGTSSRESRENLAAHYLYYNHLGSIIPHAYNNASGFERKLLECLMASKERYGARLPIGSIKNTQVLIRPTESEKEELRELGYID
jgi:hypothetical protein